MFAVREIAEIKNNNVVIQMPIDFPSKKVEVIILPLIENKSKKYSKKKIDLPELISIERNDYASKIILEVRG